MKVALSNDQSVRLPIWLEVSFDALQDPRQNPTAQLKHALDLTEALVQHLDVLMLSAWLQRRREDPASGPDTITREIARAIGKPMALGDWVRVFAAFAKQGPLADEMMGYDPNEPFRTGHPVVEVANELRDSNRQAVRVADFFRAVVPERNRFAHHGASEARARRVAPLLRAALVALITEIPAVLGRPLCYVDRFEHVRGGSRATYYALTRMGVKIPEAPVLARAPRFYGESLWFWDEKTDEAIAVPEWLAYRKPEGTLWMYQGMLENGRTLLFHCRQDLRGASNQERKEDLHEQIRQDLPVMLQLLGASGRATPEPAHASEDGPSKYAELVATVLRDGAISADERALLDVVARQLGLDAEQVASIERAAVEGRSTDRPTDEAPDVQIDEVESPAELVSQHDGDERPEDVPGEEDPRLGVAINPALEWFLGLVDEGDEPALRALLRALPTDLTFIRSGSKKHTYVYAKSPINDYFVLVFVLRDGGVQVGYVSERDDDLRGEEGAYAGRLEALPGAIVGELKLPSWPALVAPLAPIAAAGASEQLADGLRWYLYAAPHLVEPLGARVTPGAATEIAAMPESVRALAGALLDALPVTVTVRMAASGGQPYVVSPVDRAWRFWLTSEDDALVLVFDANRSRGFGYPPETYLARMERDGCPEVRTEMPAWKDPERLNATLRASTPKSQWEALLGYLEWFLLEAPAAS